jgi:predicted nucleotidyltransferase
MREHVAQEAAGLLYTGQEKEYKQAKLRAAQTLGANILPSNAEVAVKLDRIAEEREGGARQRRLVQMRREALQIMQVLKDFHPILVGSVWRGTAHHNSDVDVTAYARSVKQVVSTLRESGYSLTKMEVQKVTKSGTEEWSFHISASLPSHHHAEIVVRTPEELNRHPTCEIYGDKATGLAIQQLQQVLEENPTRKFVPV